MQHNSHLEGHVVILGWDEFSRLVLRRLRKSGKAAAIVTETKDLVEEIQEEFPEDEVTVTHRSFTSYKSFTDINIHTSLRVFVNLATDDQSLIAILNLQKEYAEDELEFVVALKNDALQETFINAGVSYAVSRYVIASRVVTSFMYEPHVGYLERDILAGTSKDEESHDLQQYYIREESSVVGATFGEVFWSLKDELNCLTVGVSKFDGSGHWTLVKDSDDDLKLAAGDYLLVIVKNRNERALAEKLGIEEGLYQ